MIRKILQKAQIIVGRLQHSIKNRESITKYRDLYKRQFLSLPELREVQRKKMIEILQHSYEHVPYYRKLLSENGFISDGKIVLNSLEDIKKLPFLDKNIIREQGEKMYSEDYQTRGSYKKVSSGSTSEPIEFVLDENFKKNCRANMYLIFKWRKIDNYYGSIIRLWANVRETVEKKKNTMLFNLKQYIGLRIKLNSFNMTPEMMREYIGEINRLKPEIIFAYAQAIYELAKFAKENNIKVEKQNVIHTGAGAMYDFMRETIESVFQCKVFNHYGGREVDSIASECWAHDGLHELMEHNYTEIIDENGNPCLPGQEGEIVVTSFSNYSMPFIRYKVGDYAIPAEYKKCACGCNYPKLDKITGRQVERFKTKSGKIITSEYFIYLVGILANDGSIGEFQIIQKDYDLIHIKLVPLWEISKKVLDEITEKTKTVMGDDCRVQFEMVNELEKTRTGKLLCSRSEVK
jgi:phenylacetate-CoA ligase